MNGLVASAIERPRLTGLVDCALGLGELVGLVGPNGAGKTTLLRALANLTSGGGQVSLEGASLDRLSPAVRARRIAFMPTLRRVGWPMRVSDIVALGLQSPDPVAVETILHRLGCAEFAERRIDTLSTGEQARVLLARALVSRADFLLLDEPTANLDPRHEIDVMDILTEERARGAGVLASFHNLQLAERFCDRCMLMAGGRIVADGPPRAVLSDARLAEVYGIRRGDVGWLRAGASTS